MSDLATLQDLHQHGIEPVPEIIWDIAEPLRPGMDYHDGITYFTLPGRLPAPPKMHAKSTKSSAPERRIDIACISSQREKS